MIVVAWQRALPTTMEVFASAVSVAIIVLIANDGETDRMESVQFLTVYVILTLAFFSRLA